MRAAAGFDKTREESMDCVSDVFNGVDRGVVSRSFGLYVLIRRLTSLSALGHSVSKVLLAPPLLTPAYADSIVPEIPTGNFEARASVPHPSDHYPSASSRRRLPRAGSESRSRERNRARPIWVLYKERIDDTSRHGWLLLTNTCVAPATRSATRTISSSHAR